MPEAANITVFVCSNPRCDAVWDADPNGHCPKCLDHVTGGGWSTMTREVRQLPAATATTKQEA